MDSITEYHDLFTNGELDENKVKSLVNEHNRLKEQSSEVYNYVTKGLLKKDHYSSDVVINMVKSIQKDYVHKDTVYEDMMTLAGNDEFLKRNLKDYFS